MPKVVKLAKGQSLKFGASAKAQSKYPWSKWFATSEPQEFIAGEDFDGGTEVPRFVLEARLGGARLYKHIDSARSIQLPDGGVKKLPDGHVVLTARDMTPEERVEEDTTRQKRKAQIKEAAAKRKAAASLAAEKAKAPDTSASAAARTHS